MISAMDTPNILQDVALTPDVYDALMASGSRSEDFMICGRRLRLYANGPEPIAGFRQRYGDFSCPSGSGNEAELTLLCARSEDPVPTLTFVARDRAYRTTDPSLVADPFPILDHLLVSHIRTHYLVHAGCVCRRDRAIVVAGASHMGKTTLTAFLVSRGMGFLSDEISPISRTDGTVAPFPMELGIRAGPAAALVDALPGTPFECGNDRKKLVNARHLSRVVVKDPLPLHAVVFLSSRMQPGVSTATKFEGTARVLFADMNDSFRAAVLARTQSELLAEDVPAPGLFSLLLKSRQPARFLAALRSTAGEHGVPICFVEYEDLGPRDFNADPQLMKLPAAAGVMELVKKIPSSQKAELVRTQHGGSVPRLIEELTTRVGDVGFYRLTPGRLEAMLQAVENLA